MSDSTGKNSDARWVVCQRMQKKFQSRQMARGQDFSRYLHINNPDGAVCQYSCSYKVIYSIARGKGPNPGRVQIVTLSKAQREFREGLYEPSGGEGANFGQMIQEAKYFRLARQWLREGYTATIFESHFITQSSTNSWSGRDLWCN